MKESISDNVATFVFYDEDHTIGNSLRYILMKNKQTEFCGYTVPHPLENKMNMRLQTNKTNTIEVMSEGLDNLALITEHVMTTFNEQVEKFNLMNEE
jgi:DNA-directed RNA polymerases I and III subunit RPAC2